MKVGDPIRCGVVDVGMTESAKISDIVSNPKGIMQSISIDLGSKDNLYINKRPKINIILAVPRPQKLERLLPIISCLGVRNIFLIQARKVEKDYFGKGTNAAATVLNVFIKMITRSMPSNFLCVLFC